ncbi:unnamed protein product [Effrenium voratum]|nr:unnamed protein product [Effrenium voratum]
MARNASFALYDALELARDASPAEVKRSYRRLAALHHPDKGGDQERFKEVSFAYEVLSDPERRLQYDEKGDRLFYTGPPANAEELAERLFQGPGGKRLRKKTKQKFVPLSVSLEQLYLGSTEKLFVLRKVVDTSEPVRQCVQCKGMGAALGALLPCKACAGTGNTWKVGQVEEAFEIFVEKGAVHGHAVVFAGKADEQPGSDAGDLKVVLHEKEHPRFKRRGADLFCTMEVSLLEALTGFRRVLEHLDGRRLVVKSGESLQPAADGVAMKAVKGQGMPLKGQPFRFGNLFVAVKVIFPTERSEINGVLELLPEDAEEEVGKEVCFVDRDPMNC